MREFSKKEKNLIKEFLQLRNDNDIVGLQVAKFIRKNLDCFALKYQIADDPKIVFYSKSDTEADKNKVNHNYIKICDFIYFLQELEEYGFIKFQRNVSEMISGSKKGYYLLFDRDKYKYDETSDNFYFESKTEFNGKQVALIALGPVKSKENVNLDFVKDLATYGNAIIYPLQRLQDFVDKKFRTLEQVNVDKQNLLTLLGILAAFAVGIASPFISKWISEKSDNESLEQVISAIKEEKSISIDKFPDILPDTLNVKVTGSPEKQPINLNVTVKENQPTKIQ